MAIRGGLAEFSVPELLQLLALQQKTGVLALTHHTGETHVLFFWRGRILAAADRRRSGRHQFLQHLLSNLVLTTDQIESVEDISRTTGQDIFTVILASGVISRDRLTEEMQAYSQLVCDGLVNWVNGTYDFGPCDEKELPVQGVPLNLNPEELVLESMRRADELATMKESMLAPDLILARAEDAPSDPLPREMALILRFIDGTKTVEAVCRQSPLGEYLTYEAISALLSRSRIIMLHPKDAPRVQGPVRGPKVSWSVLAAILFLIAGSTLLGSGIHPLLSRSEGDEPWLGQDATARRDEIRASVQTHVAALAGTAERD